MEEETCLIDGGKQDSKQLIPIMVGKALRTECLMKIGNLKKEPLKKSCT